MSKPVKYKPKTIPKFRSEKAERAFWQKHDSTLYVDWSKAKRARYPNLQLSTATISLRLPQGMLDELKVRANKQDVPYQSLLKFYLAERLMMRQTAPPHRRSGA